MQESTHKVPKSASRAVLSKEQLTLHATLRTPHGASRLMQATPVWSMITRHAPSRRYRDARVYSHTTTAVHDNNGYTPAVALLVDIVGNESYSLTAADPGVGGVF